MKFLILLTLISTSLYAGPSTSKKTLPVSKVEEGVKKDKATHPALKAIDKKEEDCDDKAKKPVEITPESISLGGNAGCTLE